jgi:hypothetical protein
LEYQRVQYNRYFWRNHAQQDIDYIEERNGIMTGYEFKWNAKAKVKTPSAFLLGYPGTVIHAITPENMDAFITSRKL